MPTRRITSRHDTFPNCKAQGFPIFRHNEQRGRCYYCGNAMWEREIEPEDDALRRCSAYYPGGTFDSDRKLLEATICTLEHKLRQADGGTDAESNLVAACLRCNSRRNELSVEDVLSQIAQSYAQPETGRSFWPDAATNTMVKRKHEFDWQRLVYAEVSLTSVTFWKHQLPTSSHIAFAVDEALVFPGAHLVPKDIAYLGRSTIAGIRAAFENPEHAKQFERDYREFVVFSTNNAEADWLR